MVDLSSSLRKRFPEGTLHVEGHSIPKSPQTEFWIWIAPTVNSSAFSRWCTACEAVTRDRRPRVRKQPGSEKTGQLNITFMAKHHYSYCMAQQTVIFMDLFHDIFHQLVIGVILP